MQYIFWQAPTFPVLSGPLTTSCFCFYDGVEVECGGINESPSEGEPL